MKVMIVDPPSGWMYGFPKRVENYDSPNDEWFLANGYPQELIDQGMLQYCRFWFEESNDQEKSNMDEIKELYDELASNLKKKV